jgi:hypothetical protein
MRSILVLLEDIVRLEFGANDLAKVRAVAAERFDDIANGTGPAGRVAAFVRAISEVRRRPLPEVYTFVGMRLTETVVKDFPMTTRDRHSSRQVLQELNQIAPAVLDALVPGVDAPAFDVELVDAEALRLSFLGSSDAASLLEGVVRGLGQHFGERVESKRSPAPSYAPERRLIDVKFGTDRRTEDAPPPTGVDRRKFFLF